MTDASTTPAGVCPTSPRAAGAPGGTWTHADLLPSYRHSLKITRGLLTKARLLSTFDRRYRADPPKLQAMQSSLEDTIWYITTGRAPWWWGSSRGTLAQEVAAGIGGRRLA